MFKFIRRLLLAIAVLLLILFFARNRIGVWVTENTLEKFTGLSVRIQYVDIRWSFSHMIAHGVTILNPWDEFHERQAINIDSLEATFDPLSILRGKPHFQNVTIDISEVWIVRNAKGDFNLKRLQASHDQKKEKESSMLIDELTLSLGNVNYLDEKQDHPKPRVYEVHAKNRVYKNVHSPDQVKSIAMNLILRALPANILNLLPETITEGVKGITDTIEEGAKSILNIFGGENDKSKSHP